MNDVDPKIVIDAALKAARAALFKEVENKNSTILSGDKVAIEALLFNTLSDACYAAQTLLGQGDGGPASIFFSGGNDDQMQEIFLRALGSGARTPDLLINGRDKDQFEHLFRQYIDFEILMASEE